MSASNVRTETATFADDGRIPNSRLPAVLYRGAIAPNAHDPAAAFEKTFAENDWRNSWRNGIYPFHHYHSTSHEVLGIAKGHGRVQLGGEAGQVFEVTAGDVLVLPAGTGHKRLSASPDFLVVGAYPHGRDWDLICGDDSDQATHDAALARIAKVPMPAKDPVGSDLLKLWRAA